MRGFAVEMHYCSHFARKFTGKVPRQDHGPHCVRACAIEMHLNISQEPLFTETYRKTARAQSEHPDQAPAFTSIVRTLQCGHIVWGKTNINI